ncbi:MAG: Na+/H+ antiporter NhaA [Acidobacteria bacterium]|nr:Na+/H+ antiporter NhaA [Acidobacteriota bacterium]
MANKRGIRLVRLFGDFMRSERAGAALLIACTVASLLIANSASGADYIAFWHKKLGPLSIELWVNDGLMAIFFLLVGLELEREILVGKLSNLKSAMLPIFAALGGIIVPAAIHFIFNHGHETQDGVGIPMATDIAFAIGALALLGSRASSSLKVFLVALAVIDDLAAIVVIAVFYTAKLSILYLLLALALAGVLFALNFIFRVKSLVPYLIGGVFMWWAMLLSGVHATIAGVILAFTIPFLSSDDDDTESPSEKLENWLHAPVAFFVLPIFALANTGLVIESNWAADLASPNTLGIGLGLVIGKPLGIFIASYLAVATGFCALPKGLGWRQVLGIGMLGGIGFTMSIFITNLAFPGRQSLIDESKLAIFGGSLISAVIGLVYLYAFSRSEKVAAEFAEN